MTRLKSSRKGTSLPLELIVVFLILLTVSFVFLNIFRSQLTGREITLNEQQRLEIIEQQIASARATCKDLCAQASLNRCSDRDIVSFCSRNIGPLDLNRDGSTTGFNTDLLAQIGVCEDKIYCPLIHDCVCATRLITLEICEEKLVAYWDSMGVDVDTALTAYTQNSEACQADEAYDESILWSNNRFPSSP